MSMREVYRCNICQDEVGYMDLYGCNFSGIKKFKLDEPGTTKGTHICFGCLRQLEVQIPETKASITYQGPVDLPVSKTCTSSV